jgi:DNA-binding XRE family transcriptional regulator
MMHVDNINGLHRAIGLHIIEKENPMSRPEFRFLRSQMGLSRAELAKDFGVSDQTIANYEKGIPIGPADVLIRAWYLLSASRGDAVGAVNPVLRPGPRKRKKLADVPRRRLVERWVENELRDA